ncbi:GLABROUS1 enhancer-binding protein family [Arabidopsis suecica]|uniref:GLABROUS1 enhancer-binding protein family n=1 Tax=Arabidopsis suecica TaxID=45249 RepID=A0A8T2CME2_ARASU|nr:GLABROUS1 enhancer-binding protein family [Arabidopsis suecica]
MKGITKLFVSRSLKSPMAKKNKKRSQPENKLSKPKSKRLKPEEDPSTVKRCLLEDPPTKKRSPQPLENPPTTESSGDDEEMATEEEGHESCSSSEEEGQQAGSSSEEEEQKDAGKNYPTKKNYFQRKWSEDDEIILLQSMVDFKNDIGKSPYDDMIVFIDTVKNIISFQANQNQFTTKIRRLKEKYVRKRNKSADENSFANAHDLKCFQLSKVIWESTKVKEESLKPNEEKVVDWFVNSSFVGSIASFGVAEDVVKQRWSMVSMKTKKELEEKFKLLKDKESEYLWLMTRFFHEVNSMITEAN